MMSVSAQSVVVPGGVIVSPKKPDGQVKFRWDPDLIDGIKEIAARTNRSINEAGELLMRWAVDRAKAELEITGETSTIRKKTQ